MLGRGFFGPLGFLAHLVMIVRPLGLTVMEQPPNRGCFHVYWVNRARPGREQPKLRRLVFKGIRVRAGVLGNLRKTGCRPPVIRRIKK